MVGTSMGRSRSNEPRQRGGSSSLYAVDDNDDGTLNQQQQQKSTKTTSSSNNNNSHRKRASSTSSRRVFSNRRGSIESGGTSNSNRIYQPPVLRSGFQGRNNNNGLHHPQQHIDPYAPSDSLVTNEESFIGTKQKQQQPKQSKQPKPKQPKTQQPKQKRSHYPSSTASRMKDPSGSNVLSYTSQESAVSTSRDGDRSMSYYRELDENQTDSYYTEEDNRDQRRRRNQHHQQQQQQQQQPNRHNSSTRSNRSRGGSSRHQREARQEYEYATDYYQSPNDYNDNPNHNHNNNNNNNGEKRLTPRKQKKLSQWYQNRFPVMSKSESTVSENDTTFSDNTNNDDGIGGATYAAGSTRGLAFAETELHGTEQTKYQQEMAYCSIAITAIQLLILMLQFTMCGVAPLDVNPMVGPFPDAFSEWGGKNSYLMLNQQQWWRIITPTFLHVGILHFIANAFCQLEAVAMFEREWGSIRWILIYLGSTIGCAVFSNLFDVDTIAVGSSGSIMGLYAAKLAEVTNVAFFETNHRTDVDEIIRLDQLSSVLCGLVLISLLGSFTFIDWSGNMGGLVTGFLVGLIVFGDTIKSCCIRFFWMTFTFSVLMGTIGYVTYEFIETADPDEQLGNVCEYYRHLYPENVECGCFT